MCENVSKTVNQHIWEENHCLAYLLLSVNFRTEKKVFFLWCRTPYSWSQYIPNISIFNGIMYFFHLGQK